MERGKENLTGFSKYSEFTEKIKLEVTCVYHLTKIKFTFKTLIEKNQ